MKVTIVKSWKGEEEIHKAGCADLKRRNRPYQLSDAMTMEATSLEEIYRAYWECIDDEAVGDGLYPTVQHAWYAWQGEFNVKPCAQDLEPMEDPDQEDQEEFEVNIEPTAHSRKDGYDLTITRQGHGWSTSDLTLSQLMSIRNVLSDFIDERLIELLGGENDGT